MEPENLKNLKSKLGQIITRIDNETATFEQVFSAFLEYSPKNRNPFLQETLFKPLNQSQNTDHSCSIDLDSLMEISFGGLWNNKIGRKKILEAPHFFAQRQCRLEQAMEKVLGKFEELRRENLEKILNFVMHILKTARTVMDFTEAIAENDELDMEFLGQIFGRTDILVMLGPIDSMILCQCENWNNVNEPFGTLCNFNEWEIRKSCRRHRHENTTVYIGSGYVVKRTNLLAKVKKSFKDSAHVEATVHRFLQNEYESSRYQFTGPCSFINKFLGCTQPEDGNEVRIISETHIDFFDTFADKYKRNYGSCKQKFWSKMSSLNIPQSEWSQHMSPWEEFIAVPAIQSLLGLYYMHKMGVVHRDFKMENLVGNADGTEIKIIDFALCKMFGPECETARCSECVGTPAYMAPEVLACGEGTKARKSRQMLPEFDGTYDGRAADVWSWGDMVIGMLLFEDPFIALNNTDKIFRLVTSDSYMISELRDTSRFNIRQRMGLKKKTWMVSDNLCDLLSNIFVPEKERATIDDILNHSWVQKHLEKFHDELVKPLNFSIPLEINSKFNTYEEENCIISTPVPWCTLSKKSSYIIREDEDKGKIMQGVQVENTKIIKPVATFIRQDHCLNTRITNTNAAAAGATCVIRGGPASSSLFQNSIMEDKKKKFFLQTVMIKVDEDSEDVSMGGDDEDDEMEDSSGEISIEQIYVERGSSDSESMVIKSASDRVVEREDLNIFPLVLDQHQQLGILPLVMTISSSLGFDDDSLEVEEEEDEIGGGDMDFYEEYAPDAHVEPISIIVVGN